LFAGIQVGQHVLLDAANPGAGHREWADSESLVFEGSYTSG
jgi:hypothetical protein